MDREERRWRFDEGGVRIVDVKRKVDDVGSELSELIGRRRDEKRVKRDFEVWYGG